MSGADGLFERVPFTDEIAVLRDLYPRSVWPGHKNLGQTAKFWLQRHDMFRELGEMMTTGAGAFLENQDDPRAFMGWLAPRLNLFLRELHSHHHVEDVHYFPIFRAADERLGRGFDILDADHHTIDALIHDIAGTAMALQTAIQTRGEVRRAADAFAQQLGHTTTGLIRHLDDEEDIVVPLILDRTEVKLGV